MFLPCPATGGIGAKVIKTRRTRLAALIRQVKAIHPYSLPEVIALPLTGGSLPYLAWVRESTS